MAAIDSIKARSKRRHDSSFIELRQYDSLCFETSGEKDTSFLRSIDFVFWTSRSWLESQSIKKLLRSALSFGRIYDRENPRRTRSPSIKNYTSVFRVFELLAMALKSNHPGDCLTRLRLTITFRPIGVKLTSIEIECTI
jgi:hypothetical protein